jgi:hypothetical protein
MHVMAIGRGQFQAVDLLEAFDDGDRRVVEGQLALEGMKHDALEQIPQ